MSKTISLCILAALVIAFADYTKSECTSDLLRDFAVDACNHINKRSTLPNIYKVEDLYARHHFTRHYKKLKREDFPDGGYLRIRHAHYLKHQRHSKKLSNNIPDDTHNGVLIYSQDSKRDHHNSRYFIDIDSSAESNDVFDDLEPADFIYKSHESLHRGRRDASKEIPIDYCCTQSGHDLCRRYSCH